MVSSIFRVSLLAKVVKRVDFTGQNELFMVKIYHKHSLKKMPVRNEM